MGHNAHNIHTPHLSHSLQKRRQSHIHTCDALVQGLFTEQHTHVPPSQAMHCKHPRGCRHSNTGLSFCAGPGNQGGLWILPETSASCVVLPQHPYFYTHAPPNKAHASHVTTSLLSRAPLSAAAPQPLSCKCMWREASAREAVAVSATHAPNTCGCGSCIQSRPHCAAAGASQEPCT